MVRLHSTAVRHVITDILKGMAHLHAQGYVHCDIKPANILVTHGGANSNRCFKLADLGSAATLKEAQSGRYGIGSPAYCAPERLYNQFGFASDIYSVGIVAFELLTGHLPFMGEVDEVYRAHLTRPMPLGEIKDSSWREWLEQATHKVPRNRFQTTEAALTALEGGFSAKAAVPSPHSYRDSAIAQAVDQPLLQKPPQTSPSVGSQKPDCLVLKAPNHSLMLAGSEPDYAFFASEAGLKALQFSTGQLIVLTASKGPYCPHLDGIAYSSGNRILHVSPAKRLKTTIIDAVDQPVSLAVSDELIVFVEQRRVVVQRRSDASVCLALRHRHYAMDPLVALGTASFAITEGLANNELWIRNFEGDVILKMASDGPWVGLCAGAGMYIAVCSSLVKPERLKIYTLHEDGRQQHQEVVCASLAVATCTKGVSYVGADQRIRFVCCDDFSAHVFSPSMEDVQSLALQSDGASCLVSHLEQGHLQVTRFMLATPSILKDVL